MRTSFTIALLTLCSAFVVIFALAFDKPSVRVAPSAPGPRTLEDQTRTAVIKDYMASWNTMGQAFEANNPALLDSEFVGSAREKLANTIEDQRKAGIQTLYQDRSHDISLVFYSPEGLSVQLLDTVEYDVKILDHGKEQASQHVRCRYVAVLTPTEVRWKVRIFQSSPS
jgi:hypothetical protein